MGKLVRGKQQAFVTTVGDGSGPASRQRPQERKVIYLWLPRRYVNARSVDVQAFVTDVNKKILERGFVTYDGQILRTPITDISVGAGLIEVERQSKFSAFARVGKTTEVVVDGDGSDCFDTPVHCDWGKDQQALFGLTNPYQMSEDHGSYTTSNLSTSIVEPYLLSGELIVALVHGVTDHYYFYCECHSAEVVYTNRHRLVCMGCGAMHLALRAPIVVAAKRIFTAEEWFQHFDQRGELRYDEVEVAILDFCDVENAETIWTTDRWESAKHRFVFFARSSPEEIEDAVRGTEADPSIFFEAGWDEMELQPPPAEQLAEDSVDVDLIGNSAHAARDGVLCFLGAQTNPSQLVNAIPHLFRSIELLLKAKLEHLDAQGLADHPNNPTVMNRLAAQGIVIAASERNDIDRLRRLRNQLQHGTAKFNYRKGLAIARNAIVFIDRFALELECWLGDVVSPDDRLELFQIKQVAANAHKLVAGRVEDARSVHTTEITTCSICLVHAVVRKHPRSGAVCYYCGHPPLEPSDSDDV